MCVYVFGLDSLCNKDNHPLPMCNIIFAKPIFLICLPYIITLKYTSVLHVYKI